MKSATQLLLGRTYEEVWFRGEGYANSRKTKVLRAGEKEVEATVNGTKQYSVSLKFANGGISKSCTCPYAQGTSKRKVCKHMVAVAILWDELRSIPRPVKEEVESQAIPPPLVSYALFEDPLHADLEILRIASSESGRWSRPHARLPNRPAFSDDINEPLTLQEIPKAFREIKRWTRHRLYDFYFCAGEMVAGFCEVMRMVKRRIAVTPPLISAEILREAQKFHYVLVMRLIDDSDGLHVFGEAHLEDICRELEKVKIPEGEKKIFRQKLQEFYNGRDDY
ncbi:MAG: SWIM zinc finger family protein [Candidatus Brocadiales bacterium]|nr:SWIM zinc finger family protein [Candidatus Brocadiales bacterium]